jgi:hypothetical protein
VRSIRVDRRGVRFLESERLGDEVERRPYAHRRVTAKRDQQRRTYFGLQPCRSEGSDKQEFEGDMGCYPKPPARYTAPAGLNDIWAVRPSRIKDAEFVKAAAEADQGKCCSQDD